MVTFPDKISPCVGATGTLKKKKRRKNVKAQKHYFDVV